MTFKQVHLATTRLRGRCQTFSTPSQRVPWFIPPGELVDLPLDIRPSPYRARELLPLTEDTPDHLRTLHSELCTSLYLEALLITRPIEPLPGPPLPFVRPRGSRRKRGGTDAGIGIDVPGNGVWDWLVLAQVKEGSERKGSINNVIRVIRKTLQQLASRDPSLTLPPNRRQSLTDDWAMLDVGYFAVHILSRSARERWFPTPM